MQDPKEIQPSIAQDPLTSQCYPVHPGSRAGTLSLAYFPKNGRGFVSGRINWQDT